MSGFAYAFSLSKEAVKTATPPGTAKLIDHDLVRTISGHHSQTVDHIRLVPQPSRDPADPLNWSKWRKVATLFCVSLYPFVANITSASLASALPFLAAEFMPPIPPPDLGHLIAVNVLMFGGANIWWVPMANIFGRRPVILLSLLILTVCSVWAAKATTYNSLLAARIFQGIGGAASDTLCPNAVGEIFFRHQRGRAMAIYTVFLALGPIIGGIVGSYIAAAHGWRWSQWLNVILSAFTLVCCALLQAETLFDRNAAIAGVTERRNTHEDPEGHLHFEKQNDVRQEQVEPHTGHTYQSFSFDQSLRVGMYRGNVVKEFLAPWLTLRLPAVWVVMLHYGGLVGGIVTISTIGPQLVSMPPYDWGKNAGLINVGGLIGTVLGAAFTYLIADRLTKRQAQHEEHGLSEPESRLPALMPGLFLAVTGLWMFGFCAANPSHAAWVGLEVGYGMLTFGLMQVPSIDFNYIIEAYPALSGDCFVMITCLRAVIGFAWTFFVGEWIQKAGPAEPFGIFGMLLGVFALLTVPLYLYGKRVRIATKKWALGPEHH
ncbi:hypothetical protein BAUCODRAFT_102930 [Baudoinia panamericana UAMH 10762]|uniref:Major facilitator superfamily (MFS) profile domain-containing protein n=1 Tax=Baudoinia panamericana (strain UAMH 10762) TaxID=717646 RepID=M2NH03_BAUPA|nr:uncharacterized protein BAUCODRAFT_102930 [Baudoinia panamericana UAMH 10762]EMC98599.1 hypothetical protein BAUCODRAFT_102930 [Baudoinia panamericana UAMH 10762]